MPTGSRFEHHTADAIGCVKGFVRLAVGETNEPLKFLSDRLRFDPTGMGVQAECRVQEQRREFAGRLIGARWGR